MRNNAARWGRMALLSGLLLVGGLANVDRARAQDGGTPWLGIYLQDLTSELREGMDYRGTGGVIVSRVVRGGPADRAGVRNGDVIVRLNQRTVDSPGELQEMVRSMRVGQSVQVEVFRDGDRRMLNARLDGRPEDDMAPRAMEDEEMDAPEPPEPPRAPRAPRAPQMPRDRVFEVPDLEGLPGVMAPRGRLGVRIESLKSELGDYFGVPDGNGVLVLEVLDGTPAERAGLKAGDVITRVDGDEIRDNSDLVETLRGKSGKVELRILRHREARTIEATLEKPQPMRMRLGEGPNAPHRRIIVNGKEISPGDFEWEFKGDGEDEGKGDRKRVIVRRLGDDEQQDLRKEMERLREELEELKKELQEQEGSGRR